MNDDIRHAVRASLKAGALTSVAGTTSYIAILVTAILFASTGAEAALLRSHLVPLTLLFGGVSMLFSVPSQIAGTRGSRYAGGNTIRQWGAWTAGICAIFGLLFALCWITFSTFGRGLLADVSEPGAAVTFLSFMALGYLPVAGSDFIEGYLRGSGRFVWSSTLVVTRASITCVSYALGIYVFNVNPLSLPAFYALGGLTTFLIGAVYSIRSARRSSRPATSMGKVGTGKLVRSVGLPVLASYMLLSSVVSVQIVAVEVGAGRVAQIAFSAMLMVQTLCVVAAIGIAAGVSSEILRRAAGDRLNRSDIGAIVARTSTIIFGVEAVMLVIFLCFHESALRIFLSGISTTGEIRIGAIIFVVAALLTANNVFALTVLEEIGLATLSLILNAIYFGVLIGVTYWAALAAGTFLAVSVALVALSALASVGIRILLKHLPSGVVVG